MRCWSRRSARCLKGFIVNKFRGDLRLFDDGLAIIARAHRTAEPRRRALLRPRRAPAGGRRASALPTRTEPSDGRGDQDRRAAAAAHRQFRRSRSAAAGARCRASRSCRPAGRCPAMPISSCCRARSRPSPISPFLRAAGLGHRHRRPSSAAAAACSASAAATRCSAAASPIPRASRGRPARSPASALLDVETELTGDKTLGEVHGDDMRQRTPVARLRDACRPHPRPGDRRGRCCG